MKMNRTGIHQLLRLHRQAYADGVGSTTRHESYYSKTIARKGMVNDRTLLLLRPGQTVLQWRSFRMDRKTYDDMHARSVSPQTREDFWKEQATKLQWERAPTKILDDSKPNFARWFPDGTINASVNCLDRHVAEGRGDQVALIYDSPVTGQKTKYTYKQLLTEVENFAGVLRNSCDIQKGDAVVIYMPMIPEAVIAMLACARLGAPHSVVFGGFASRELAIRIDDVKAKAIVSASCGVEPNRIVEYEPLLQGALELSKNKPRKVVSKHRSPTSSRPNLPPRSKANGVLDWDEEMLKARPVKPVPVVSTDPLYVLYTSGSTGTPKGIVRDTGGYCASMSFSMDKLMRAKKGDVYFTASDVGWVVGHSYIVYGPLIAGCTTVLYEGKPVGTPDAAAFWRLISEYKINHMFAAPTALRAIRKVDPNGELLKNYNLSSLQAFFWAGERADPETVSFYSKALSDQVNREVPIVDCFWQTETGWPVCGIQDIKKKVLPGSTSKPLPGFDVCILEDAENVEGGSVSSTTKLAPKVMKENEMGMICIRNPLPPGTLLTVHNNDARYLSGYMQQHPGYYTTGDMGFRDHDGYITVMSRNDDLINVAGHRLSTGTLEQAISGHPEIAEVACVGAHDSLKGEVCVGFIVVKSNVDIAKDGAKIEKECIQCVRELVGPVASFHNCYLVQALPKTRSGKVLRTIIRRILNGDSKWVEKVPGTVEDINVLYAIETTVKERWVPQ